MQPALPPDFLAELFRQLAFLAAVLGGFAVAFLGALLPAAREQRVGTWAIGAAAVAATGFVVMTLAATLMALGVLQFGFHTFDDLSPALLRLSQLTAALFVLGIYSLLLSLALSGWTRSRATGWCTTTVALLGAVAATMAIALTAT